MWEMFCKTNDSIRIWTELFNGINKSVTSRHSWFVPVLCFRATSKVAPIYSDFLPLPFILNSFSGHYAGPLFHLHSMSQMGPYSCPLSQLISLSCLNPLIFHSSPATIHSLHPDLSFLNWWPVFVQQKGAHSLYQPLLDLAPYEIPPW